MPTRAEALRAMEPQLVADLTLYPTSEGGEEANDPTGLRLPLFSFERGAAGRIRRMASA